MALKFVVPLTVKPYELRRIIHLWDESGDSRNPFERVLVTPCFCSPTSVSLIREELRERRGSIILFDSGGYQAQQGRITYEKLYGRLLAYYLDNQWADWYVLPDHAPISIDDPEAVEHKVRDTVTVARLFYSELPPSIRERALPVVQGHTPKQIQWCLDSYEALGVRRVGFGSFSTTGALNSINFLSKRSEEFIQWISGWSQMHDSALHLFGISGPDLFAFRDLDIDSCDSMNWYKAANFGKIFFPFVRAYSVTGGSAKLRGISEDEFYYLKDLTGHDCRFCQSFEDLAGSYWLRRMHNLTCVLDAIEMLNRGEEERIRSIFDNGLVKKSIFRRKYGHYHD